MGIIAFSVTGRGLLSLKYNEKSYFSDKDIRSIDPLFKNHKLNTANTIAMKLKGLGKDLNLSPVQLGILWTLQQEGVIGALTGPTKISHLKENIKIMNTVLSQAVPYNIDDIIKKEHYLLEKKLIQDISRVLTKKDIVSIEKGYDDIVGVLEYLIEKKIPYEVGILIYRDLIINKRNKRLDDHLLILTKQKISNNLIK